MSERLIDMAGDLLLNSAGGSCSVDSRDAVELARAVLEELGEGTTTCVECACEVARPLREGMCPICYDERHNEEREHAQFSPLRPGDI